ncbi:hypothetical protein AB0C93_34490 [Streptomyces sp. NPDC048518]|uniref:hypothetical protein n=1 Tax=Streptomyces sp. NPDC048518 TaxID=3155029 RepID=UPI00340F94ED
MNLGKALSTGIAEERPALHEEPVPEQAAPVVVPEPERPAQDRPAEVTAAR